MPLAMEDTQHLLRDRAANHMQSPEMRSLDSGSDTIYKPCITLMHKYIKR